MHQRHESREQESGGGLKPKGSAVRPGFRTKVRVLLVLPQTRHPERSASQIDRVTEPCGAESKDLGGAPFTMLLELFDHRSLTTGY